MINSNFGPISYSFWDMASFSLINAIFFTSLYSTPNSKMYSCTAFSKLCTQQALTRG